MRIAKLTLSLIWLGAAAVFIGGGFLARHDRVDCVPVDALRVSEFASGLQAELSRLDELYGDHLNEIADEVVGESEEWVRGWCDTVYGIRRCCVLNAAQTNRIQEILMPPIDPVALPAPIAVRPNTPSLNRLAKGSRPTHGWISKRDSAFDFSWQGSRDGSVVEFLIDRRVVLDRTNLQLKRWLASHGELLRLAGGAHRIQESNGTRLLDLGEAADRTPDLVRSIQARQGTWQVLCWNTLTPRVTYDGVTLAISTFVSLSLAVLGLVVFSHQYRSFRQAEQRVSFVNRVSHELSSPLTNIQLNLELITDYATLLPEKVQERLMVTIDEVQRLSRLVTNVLTFSRRERGRLKLNPVACVPDEIIGSVLRQFEPALARRGIEIHWQRGATARVELDADAVAQVVGNLISNVEKYAAAGRWLGIDGRIESGNLLVRVSDHGSGIPAADAGRVFEPFERLDSRAKQGSSGTGLGLAIGRDLARLMGGDLRLLPSETGALFELRLPVTIIPDTLT